MSVATIGGPGIERASALADIRSQLAGAAKRAGIDHDQKLTPAEATRRLADAGKFDEAQARPILTVVRAVQTASINQVTSSSAGELRQLANLVVEYADAVIA